MCDNIRMRWKFFSYKLILCEYKYCQLTLSKEKMNVIY